MVGILTLENSNYFEFLIENRTRSWEVKIYYWIMVLLDQDGWKSLLET